MGEPAGSMYIAEIQSKLCKMYRYMYNCKAKRQPKRKPKLRLELLLIRTPSHPLESKRNIGARRKGDDETENTRRR